MKKILLIFFLLLLTFLGYLSYKFLASKQIFLQSDHPSYTLSKTNNFSDFQNYLNEVGFWRKDAMYNPETKSPSTAKSLYIILTDTPQTGNNWLAGPEGEEKLLASFEYKIEGNNVSIYLHVDPIVAQETGFNLDNVFNTYLMRASYMLVENRGLLTEQNDKVADGLIDAKYKEPYIVLKEKNTTGFNIFKLLVPTVYAYHSGDCQSWQCGIATSSKRCVGGPNNGKSCVTSFPDCWPGGVCVTFTQCSAQYWEGHSGSSCISPKCPGSQCVVSGSNHCSCGAPTPPPCSCGSWTNQGCGGGGCPATQMYQTRTCTPGGCASQSQCVSSGSCTGASCTVNLTPDTATVGVGAATTLTASVTIGSGTVTQVDFLSGNTGVVTVNPASDTTAVYSTQANGVSNGSTTVRADVIMSGASRCNDTSTVNVIAANPWWQVIDADVTTNGDLISPIPGSCSLPACNPVFGLKGTGGFPGVPAYGGVTADFLSGAGTGSAAESPYNWLASSRYLGKTYDYAYFERQIPDDIVINEVTPPVTGGTFNSGGVPSRGYVWYHWDGSSLGDLTINGNVNLVGSRRVVLLVEAADLYINGRINLQSKGNGFFMAVVGKDANGLKGDIIVDPSVSHPTQPELEGIFLAESEFKSGASSNQLLVRGSVAAYDGVVLQRDLGADNADTPAEVFEYAPDIIATFPQVFTQRRLRWKEVAP